MDSDKREVRWRRSYEQQKAIYDSKKARKEHYLMDQKSQIENKIKQLETQREAIEQQLKKVAEDSFESYESFRNKAIRRSEEAKTPDSESN